MLEAFVAIRKGLEPSTSCVTGRRSNQLNYRTFLREHQIYVPSYPEVKPFLKSFLKNGDHELNRDPPIGMVMKKIFIWLIHSQLLQQSLHSQVLPRFGTFLPTNHLFRSKISQNSILYLLQNPDLVEMLNI